jgi:transcriptional regulator with XRE-family HTH domain
MKAMPTRERPAHRGHRLARYDLMRVIDDLHGSRVMAGLSLATVGRATGISPSALSRIERGKTMSVSIDQLARIGAVVGLDVRVRTYPSGDPVRDAAQVRLLERCRARLAPTLTFRTEVPLPIEGDLRAWDGWIDGFEADPTSASGLAVEAETRLSDLQAQTRRLTLKMRDGGVEAVLLVVADTRTNQAVLRAAAPAILELFPVPPRRTLQALAEGVHPGGSALICL